MSDTTHSKHIETLMELVIEETANPNGSTARVEALEWAQDLARRVESYETLRPVWAQGWTEDSMAAQAAGNALAQLWKMLGVDNQTDAVIALRTQLTMIELQAPADPPNGSTAAMRHLWALLGVDNQENAIIAIKAFIVEQTNANEELRALQASNEAWNNLFSALMTADIPRRPEGLPTLWPFKGPQTQAMVAYTIHTLRERIKAATALLSRVQHDLIMGSCVETKTQEELFTFLDPITFPPKDNSDG